MGLYGIIIKEFKHILRDPRTLLILFVLPVVMMTLFGYAMTLEIRNIRIIIDDRENTVQSREIIGAFEGSRFFHVEQQTVDSYLPVFQQRRADAVLTIESGFSENYIRGGKPKIGLDIDASDSNRAVIMRQYIAGALASALPAQPNGAAPFIQMAPVFLYNKELDSSFFFIPALTALLIIMVSAMLTSLTITREKEKGTFDLIKLSPVHAYEVILGKVIPYLFLSMLIGSMIVLFGAVLFSVPVRGSIAALGLYLLLYCLTGLSFGMLISTVASSQQTAMLIALVATLLPTLFLSGFIFQIEAMPRALQIISRGVPAKYFLIIIRGLMLKGNTQGELLFHILMLAGFSVFFLIVSIFRFKAYLEK